MTRAELLLAALGVVSGVLLVLMLFVAVLGVVGRGVLGEAMRSAHDAMIFVMAFFPLYAVVLTVALAWWIYKRDAR